MVADIGRVIGLRKNPVRAGEILLLKQQRSQRIRRAEHGRIGLAQERVVVAIPGIDFEIEPHEERQIVELGEQLGDPAPALWLAGQAVMFAAGEPAVGGVEALHGQRDLPHAVPAGRAPPGLAGRPHGRQEEADEHPDDRDDHQQFDECERPARCQHL